MRRGRAISKAVAAVAVPLVLASLQGARLARAEDTPVSPDPAVGQQNDKALLDEPLQLAQVRRPPIGGRPPATTTPAAETQPTGVDPSEPRILPELPSELNLRPADQPRLPANPGYVGFQNRNSVRGGDFLPVPDRWRIGQPDGSATNTKGNIFNPYGQNVLKGDYPVLGTQDIFFILGLTSETLLEAANRPIPSGVSTLKPNSFEFFGNGNTQLVNQNVIISAELFKGNAAYQPKDWVFRTSMVANVNYVHANELAVLYPDVQDGRDRTDSYFAFQELFVEKKLADVSANYDFVSIRAGIQGFSSDFRGFLFADNEPGVRLFGTFDNNRWQYNLAFFNQVEKDTNSGLNTFNFRNQQIYIANLYRQDFLFQGYTAQLSFHANIDASGPQYDQNGFLVRPAPIGSVFQQNKTVNAYYLGWAGDGHIGRFNISHQFYQVFGNESYNPIADQRVDINSQFFAVEVSYDQDYIRYRASFQYARGDDDPEDGKANGFDSIFDNPNFAGGGFSYFTRQAIALTGGGTGLVGRNSNLPSLRTSKEQGQSNFVNPGLLLFNVGMDVEVTRELKLITNASYLMFDDTSSLQFLLQDNKIGRDIGIDLGIGLEYRPLLNNNVIIFVGAACLIPGAGFKDIYTSELLYSGFVGVTLTY